MSDNSTLEEGEPHPVAFSAQDWLRKNIGQVPHLEESLASAALAGSRSAEVCLGTYKRLLEREPVSDRYMFGLAWFVRDLLEMDESDVTPEKE